MHDEYFATVRIDSLSWHDLAFNTKLWLVVLISKL